MTNAQKLKAIKKRIDEYKNGLTALGKDILDIIDEPNERVKRRDFCEQDIPHQLSAKLFNLIKTRRLNYKRPDFNKWAKDMDKILRLDKRDVSEVEMVIRWAQQDEFWCNNILSPDKLRKQFDRLALLMKQDREWIAKENLKVVNRPSGPTLREQLRRQYGDS